MDPSEQYLKEASYEREHNNPQGAMLPHLMERALVAYYDLMCCPVSFDIVSFIMWSERIRLERRLHHVEIEILPGPQEGFRRDHNWPYTTQERRLVLNQVVIPMCSLLPSCSRVTVRRERVDPVSKSIGHSEYSMAFKEFATTYANGTRPLRVADTVPHDKLVTITLRECEHWPERNSNVGEWLKAERRLTKKGYQVVIVRDTSQVNAPLADYAEPYLMNPDASTNLVCRASLYASAALNLFVNNGPTWFAMALDVPMIVFRPITETTCWAHTSKAMATCGIVNGKQMAGAPPHQRLSWLDETADNIVKEVYDFFACRSEAAE